MEAATFYARQHERWSHHGPKYTLGRDALAARQPGHVVDVGCGAGDFLAMVAEVLPKARLTGLDLDAAGVEQARKRGFDAEVVDLNSGRFPLPDASVEGLSCFEVIEHLYDTDHLLQEIRRVLSPRGLAVLTTPNLAAWYNRLLLLGGYQPAFTEVSLRHLVGHPGSLNAGQPVGHIRAFTARSLGALCERNGLRVARLRGLGMATDIGAGARAPLLTRTANALFRGPGAASFLYAELERAP